MTHENDIRIAEGLQNIELPADPAAAMAAWRSTLNDAVVDWHRARGCDMPDLNDLARRGIVEAINFASRTTSCCPSTAAPRLTGSVRSVPRRRCSRSGRSPAFRRTSSPGKPTPPEPMAPDDPRWPPIPAQDFSNLPRQQKGLHSKGFEYMRLSSRIEGLISNFERVIDGFLAGLPYERAGPRDPEDQHHHRRADRRSRASRGATLGGTMTTHWDRSVDLLIAGSGGGGMVAGLAALDSRNRAAGDREARPWWAVRPDFPVAWCGCRTTR